MAPLHESIIVIQKFMPKRPKFYGLTPSVDFLKIDGASTSVNEKLKVSTGTVKLAASTHTTAINYFKNVNLVLARYLSFKGMTTAIATPKTSK